MSRIGKKPIEIPGNVQVRIEGQTVSVEGPKGILSREIHQAIKVGQIGSQLFITPAQDSSQKTVRALWGTTRALIANMIEGVTRGYEKKLEIEGIGYRASVENGVLVLRVGFSHPVEIPPPEGIAFSVDGNVITVSGTDKEKVGETAAKVRSMKPPDPYKGKGIRYQGEVVRKKLGKKAATAAAASSAQKS